MSQSFRDKAGAEWVIELTIGTVERIRKAGRFNLYEPAEPMEPGQKPSLSDVIFSDYATFWELLWAIVEPQAATKAVTAEQFGEMMAAKCLVDAQSAFLREWQDFFHQLRRSENCAVLQKLEKYKAAAATAMEAKLVDPRIAAMDAEVEKTIAARAESEFTKALSAGYGKLRELSASGSENSTG